MNARPFAVAGVIATAGFLVVQFVFEGWPTLFVAMAGALIGLAAAAPIVVAQLAAERVEAFLAGYRSAQSAAQHEGAWTRYVDAPRKAGQL